MKALEAVPRSVEGFQQWRGALGLIFGVVKKLGDDNAGVLAGNLASALRLRRGPSASRNGTPALAVDRVGA